MVSGPMVLIVFLDVHITDMDAKTYQAKDLMKVFASHEKDKEKITLLLALLSNVISPLS